MDGEFESRTESTATAFSHTPWEVAWTCAAASPAFWVGLAAMLRSLPTALYEDFDVPIRRGGRCESIRPCGVRQGERLAEATANAEQ